MRLSIRAEQMSFIESETQERFVRQIVAHLLAEYSSATVTLPSEERFTVNTLPKETLLELVRVGIARARTFKMTFESSIAAFTVLMFEISPNFYANRICQVVFSDDQVQPNDQIELLVNTLSEKNIISIQENYDPAAWKLDDVPENVDQPKENTASTGNLNEPNDLDFMKTVKIR